MIGPELVMVAGCDEVGRGPLAGDVVLQPPLSSETSSRKV